MHPAVSVILFTVTSGAGFGLMFLIGLGWPMPEGPLTAFLVSAFAAGMAIFGLLSSTFHLGHPERAWRAFSQWRTSWLSREGVLAVLALGIFSIYALWWMWTGERIVWLGILASLLSALTVYSTAMIYAQLKTVPNWHSSLTPLAYLGFSLASGFLAASSIGTAEDLGNFPVSLLGGLMVLLAWAIKIAWWRRAGSIGFSMTGSSVGTATGLGKLGTVRLLEKPHSGENYLTREMVHVIGRKHAARLRALALLFGAVIPALLCVLALAAGTDGIVLGLAFLSMIAGLFAERWLFFAEARHAVSLYYS